MFPAFLILLLIFISVVYICLMFLYRPIGKLVGRIFGDFKEIVSEEREEEKNE